MIRPYITIVMQNSRVMNMISIINIPSYQATKFSRKFKEIPIVACTLLMMIYSLGCQDDSAQDEFDYTLQRSLDQSTVDQSTVDQSTVDQDHGLNDLDMQLVPIEDMSDLDLLSDAGSSQGGSHNDLSLNTDDDDDDGDGIPNDWDESPNDSSWPGSAFPDTVYAHTDDALFALDVKALVLTQVADFSFDVEGIHRITDIAIDRVGVLWAISFNTLWLCHPQTGVCRKKGSLPFTNFNGLTFIPGSHFNESRDVLIAIDNFGSWRRLDFLRDILVDELVGIYPNERSSGDAFSIEGIGTFASVKRDGVNSDIIVKVNPTSPDQLEDFVTLDGYQSIFGLAGWRGKLFAFDESGTVLMIDLETREITNLNAQNVAWWGAGVSSVIRSTPTRP
jgi:hypothetical protein